MNLLPTQLAGMFDIYAQPSFDELENLAFISQCSDEFIYLLGMCFCKKDLEQIKAFACSRLWFTYRKEFPAIGGSNFSSDVGWGCMLRCGQMLLANALLVLHLGRNWQWQLNCKEIAYRRLLSMFEDQRSAHFSIHQIAQMGVSEGKPLGEWFGPNTIAQVLKKLTVYDEWSNLAVHIAMDNILISDDVRKMAELNTTDEIESAAEPDLLTTNNDSKWQRPLLLIVPLRLGLTVINECYANAIKEFFKLPQCAGIIGGRPNHAVYFFGQAGDKLLYLDPHVSQNRVDISYGEERLRRRRHAAANNEAAMLMNYDSRPISTSPNFSSTAPSPLNVNIPEPTTDIESGPTSSLVDVDRDTQNRIDPKEQLIGKSADEENKSASVSGAASDETTLSSMLVIDDLTPATNSVVDALSSSSPPAASMPEPTNSGESFSSSSNLLEHNGESNGSSTMKHVELPKVKCLHSFTGRRRTKAPQKIISPLSHSSELSSGTEAIGSDQLFIQTYELSNSSFHALSLDGADNLGSDDTEKIEFPDVVKSGIIIGISASSSSSTEMLPPLTVTSTTGMMRGGVMDSFKGELPATNFEFVESGSTEFSNTTTEDERRDEASGESEKLKKNDDLFGSGKRKVIRQKRKMKRKVSNDTFTYDENVIPSDDDDEYNEFEDVKALEQHVGVLPKMGDNFKCEINDGVKAKVQCLKNEHSEESLERKNEEVPTSDSPGAKSPEPSEEEDDDFDDSSYHCSFILNMDFKTLDPSLALAFICLCAEDYNDLKERLHKSVLPASKPPLFEILESRPKGWPEFVPYSVHDESLKMKEYDDFGDPQFDSDDQFELLV